jgi:hypothetical protein
VDEDFLPEVVGDENVSIRLAAGFHDHGLTVNGNNLTLTGEAGDSCDSEEGWTTIGGTVDVNGSSAIFRNVMFPSPVELRGNAAHFINSCFGENLLVLGEEPVESEAVE